MVDKGVIIGGFAIGVAAGAAMLTINAQPAPINDVEVTATHSEIRPPAPEPDGAYPPSATQESQRPPSFESMVAAVAREQGGKISIIQMAMLAKIYRQQYGVPPSYSDRQIGGHRTGSGSTTNYEMWGIAPSDPYAVLRRRSSSTKPTMPAIGSEALTDPSASDRYSRAPRSAGNDPAADRTNIGAIEIGSGEYMAPAGPGAYVNTRNGTLYAPAGPNGVVDTRTGEFIPANR